MLTQIEAEVDAVDLHAEERGRPRREAAEDGAQPAVEAGAARERAHGAHHRRQEQHHGHAQREQRTAAVRFFQ